MAIFCKEIDDYLALIDNKTVLISKENQLLIENIVKPLLINDVVYFDENVYINFFKYTKKFYYELFPYHKFLAAFHFMYNNDGSLCFNEYFYLMGGGNGKDGFIGPLIHFFQTKAYGIEDYNIDIVAMSEKQAYGTFEVVKDMMKTEKIKKIMNKNFFINKERIKNKYTKSKLVYNTSNSKTKDGARSGYIAFNELHAYDNYDNIKVHTSGHGKVANGRTIIITTTGNIRGGPSDDYVYLADLKLNGLAQNLKLFPFICKLANEDDAKKIELFEIANPSINYLDVLKKEITEIWQNLELKPETKIEFLVKRLNLIKEDKSKVAPQIDVKFENGLYSWRPDRTFNCL